MRTKLMAAAAATALVGLVGVSPAGAAPTTDQVYPEDVATQPENTPPTKSWVAYVRNAGSSAFEQGPATPPLGSGSLRISTPTGADKLTVFNFDHNGTDLDAVDAMSYSTYRSAGSLQQVAALNLQVDVNGAAPGGFTTLVFEPVYNTDQGAVVSGQWQAWDAYKGGQAIWWSSNPIPSAPNRDTFVPWSTILAANPDAVVLGGVGVNQGSGNPALVTNVDAFTFDDVTYDFELIKDLDGDGIPDTAPPTTKDQCKKDGWKSFNNPTFKNQGDCVSYVATGGKNGANG
jgi:hypothetical protein